MASTVVEALRVPSNTDGAWSGRRSARDKSRRVFLCPPKAVAEEHVDRRIHYHSNSKEGWVGRPSTLSYPEASADARALQRPSAGLIKLLLEMPDTHYKYSHHPAPPRTQTYLSFLTAESHPCSYRKQVLLQIGGSRGLLFQIFGIESRRPGRGGESRLSPPL